MFDQELFSLQDLKYRTFNSRLIPGADNDTIIGVRVPSLRQLAKQLDRDRPEQCQKFFGILPHYYHEENMLHAFLIEGGKNIAETLSKTDQFIPFITNWQVCDCFKPTVFKKYPDEVLQYVRRWIESDQPYIIRFAIGLLLSNYLDNRFNPDYLNMIASVQSPEYYVKMMQAWYFATALAKQYQTTVPYIEEHRLSDWVNNKAIQKARESYRISAETKAYLIQFKV